MAIPKYEELMLPILKYLNDGQEHTNLDCIEFIRNNSNLTEEEKRETISSGDYVINNRVRWAIVYLRKAGLLENVKRGYFVISQKGKDILGQNIDKIDNTFLSKFDSFNEFKNKKNKDFDNYERVEIEVNKENTPEETMEYIVENLTQQLSDDLLEQIHQNSPSFFEILVAELLLKMGYGSSKKDILQNTGKSGDEGIDGIIKEDILGLDKIYIQAKRWQGIVGRPEIQKFAGALQMQNAHKGIFITTSKFSKDALDCVNKFNSNLVLIDGQKLAELMIRYNLGIQIKQVYEIKKIDEDFFSEGL